MHITCTNTSTFPPIFDYLISQRINQNTDSQIDKVLTGSIPTFWCSRLFPLLLLLFALFFIGNNGCRAHTDASRAIIQHFDRKSIGGGTHCPYISVNDPNRIAVANNLGLLLFDGNEWSLLDLPNGAQSRSVAGFEDLLFCGGQNFVGILDFSDELGGASPKWTDCTPQISAESGPFDDVWRMFASPSALTEEAKEYEAVFSCSEFAGSLSREGEYREWLSGPIRNSTTWKEGVAFQSSESIHFFDWNGSEIERIPLQKDWKMEGIARNSANKVILMTHAHGLQEWDGNAWNESQTALSKHLREARVNCIEKMKDTWFIGTSNGGIVSTIDFDRFQIPYAEESGLISNSVLDIKADRTGNIWVGLEGGVDLLKYNWPQRTPSGLEELKEAGHASLHLSNGSRYWGTSQGVYFQSKSGAPLKIISDIPGPIWSLSLRENDVWVCHRSGAGVISDGQFHSIIDETGVWNIWPSSDPNIWYAGTYRGLIQIKYAPRGRHPKSRWQSLGAMVGFEESSRFLREESPGIWWVSHPYKGAFRLELDELNRSVSSTKTYDASAGFPDPLQINMCNLDTRMVFATSKGFYQWDAATDRMIPDGSALSNWIDVDRSYQRIYNSPSGNIWIFADRSIRMLPLAGVSMLDDPNPRFASMGQNPVPTPFEAIEFLENGLVCIPIERGFTYLTPDLMHQVQSGPRVKISHVNHLNVAKSELSIEDESIRLKAGVHALEFKLSGLNSDWAGLIEYQWRIQNVAEQWSRPTSNSRITLSGLQPGTHAVEFRAFIGENMPCAVTPVTIFVSAYWYQLIWVRILGFFLCASLIVVFFRRNQGILEAKHLIQKQNERDQRMKTEQAMKASMEKTEMALQAQKTAAKELQLAAKNKELASATMHLVQKAQLIQTIDATLQSLKTQIPSKNQAEVDSLLNIIKDGGKLDDAWDDFTKQFDQVHVEFHQRITTRYPQLTKTDFKLCTYLRMNLSSKEIASLMFVSLRAVEVSRSRLRKRLGLSKSQNLIAFIQNI